MWRTLTSGQSKRDGAISLADWAQMTFGGIPYTVTPTQTLVGKHEEVGADFRSYVEQVYRTNGVVFACMAVRMLLFSEARFQWRQRRSGGAGDLFGNAELGILEKPWWNGTTGGLLSRMIQDVDLSGNFYAARLDGALRRMRPDWVTIVLGSKRDPGADATALDSEVLGYIYHPGGRQSREEQWNLLREQVVHFAPIIDPTAAYRGMSWLTPILQEIQGDNASMRHKGRFFEAGGTSNMVVKVDPAVRSPEAFQAWVEAFAANHDGIENLYKTIYLGAGAEVDVVGGDMKQVDFKAVTGHTETRIAAASGVPPVIVGLSEGLEAATYSNYQSAKRRLVDMTMRPLWREAAASLSAILTVPANAELWYQDADIPALQENIKDQAEAQSVQAATIAALVQQGFDPDSVVDTVVAGDFKRLKHSGLVSVQLLPPGAEKGSSNGASTNGNGTAPATEAEASAGRAVMTRAAIEAQASAAARLLLTQYVEQH